MLVRKHARRIIGYPLHKMVRSNGSIHPEKQFHSPDYLRHKARRLEHLSSLRISVAGLSVLELGAGIGDHSNYYMDRGCKVTVTEVRRENLDYLFKRYPDADIRSLDMRDPAPLAQGPFDIVHCYGLLYHLDNPRQALEFISKHCRRLLFLETCVSFGNDESINLVKENTDNPTQSWSGAGCRPTRAWLFKELNNHFEHVYIPRTQPNHKEFPINWTSPGHHQALSRAIFIASRIPIDNNLLSSELLNEQSKHE